MKDSVKNIRKEYFSPLGMVIVSALGAVGLLFCYLLGLFEVRNLEMLYECIYENGAAIIFGIFFFSLAVYCWVLFFKNVIIKPKKEILFLYKKDNNDSVFINKKGKAYRFNVKNKKNKTYYNVLKTHDYIIEVLDEYKEPIENWAKEEKKSYWMNFYSPLGNFENMFMLPIVYVILLPFLLSFLMTKGHQKLFGLFLSAIPVYIIIYDLIYKIKLKNGNPEDMDEANFIKSYIILQNSIKVLAALILSFFMITWFRQATDMISRLIFSPFLLCGLCTSGYLIADAFNLKKWTNIFLKSYIVIFLLLWFGFLIVFIIGSIKQGDPELALFTIPFWIFGIFVIKKYFSKNK